VFLNFSPEVTHLPEYFRCLAN